MVILKMSSKGRLALPAAVRRKLGLAAGSRLELSEEPDGIKLRVARAAHALSVADLAGVVTAPTRGRARRLLDLDSASLLRRAGR
ncbi:MAG: AbrB/MazE/SpoVT family DNA-binding domain-containing protein [Rubrivivax sp.]|nr:AbrB/MazE/SpoVT family DNA-binding domain-containing protein [Rubrivivax sp.]